MPEGTFGNRYKRFDKLSYAVVAKRPDLNAQQLLLTHIICPVWDGGDFFFQMTM